VELYRDIQQVYYGSSAELEALLDSPGPFWGRHYTFWHDEQPLTLIYEVFSNQLQRYLGELDPSAGQPAGSAGGR
jgi:chorismate lyase